MELLLDLSASLGAIVAVAVGVVFAILALRLRQPVLALVSAAVVALGLLAIVIGWPALPVWGAASVVRVLLDLGIAALGVLGGGPLTLLVLQLAMRGDAAPGEHGGILVDAETEKPREVLRGGATIGYLERVAILGGILAGHVEVVAAVIALKGLGRFSELDSGPARERFIIGTLVSFIWACACAALVVLG